MLRIVCFCLLATGALAIVCTPEMCESMDCEDVTNDNCAGVVKANGGFCGCCDACVIELAEGDSCSSMVLFGVPSNTQCADGLYCGENSKCEKLPEKVKRDSSMYNGPCLQELVDVNARLEASETPLLGLEKPNCDERGYYDGIQFSGSQAFCVTTNGTMIDSYMVNRWEVGTDTSCQCARDLYDYMESGLIGKLFHCNPDGSYPKDNETTSV